jgi:hypothetical protein
MSAMRWQHLPRSVDGLANLRGLRMGRKGMSDALALTAARPHVYTCVAEDDEALVKIDEALSLLEEK